MKALAAAIALIASGAEASPSLQMDLQRQRAELGLYAGQNEVRNLSSSERESELRRRRSADPAQLSSRKSANGKSGNRAAKGGNGAAK